jgi:hypothetical protein
MQQVKVRCFGCWHDATHAFWFLQEQGRLRCEDAADAHGMQHMQARCCTCTWLVRIPQHVVIKPDAMSDALAMRMIKQLSGDEW